jgi:hypothetical protein
VSDPRHDIPGPPGGWRYLCPVGGCRWYVDEPPPEIEHRRGRDGGLELVITAVPTERIEAVIAAHLAGHDEAELTAEMVARLREFSDQG